jgi:hypothetical protein
MNCLNGQKRERCTPSLERLARRYVVEHLSLQTLLEQLRVGKTWDELLEEDVL